MNNFTSREIHLKDGQWKNISESKAIFYEYNHNKERIDRELIITEIIPTIDKIIYSYLTPRQSQVVFLFRKKLTQITIAKILGISQPTVSQHLNGKKRNGKKVGGAFRKIRKKIHQHTFIEDWPYEDQKILIVLDWLLDKNITRRKAFNILNSIVQDKSKSNFV